MINIHKQVKQNRTIFSNLLQSCLGGIDACVGFVGLKAEMSGEDKLVISGENLENSLNIQVREYPISDKLDDIVKFLQKFTEFNLKLKDGSEISHSLSVYSGTFHHTFTVDQAGIKRIFYMATQRQDEKRVVKNIEVTVKGEQDFKEKVLSVSNAGGIIINAVLVSDSKTPKEKAVRASFSHIRDSIEAGFGETFEGKSGWFNIVNSSSYLVRDTKAPFCGIVSSPAGTKAGSETVIPVPHEEILDLAKDAMAQPRLRNIIDAALESAETYFNRVSILIEQIPGFIEIHERKYTERETLSRLIEETQIPGCELKPKKGVERTKKEN